MERGIIGFWHKFSRNKLAVVGMFIIIVISLTAIFADFIIPYERCTKLDAMARLQGPSAGHWFGTDEMGRDVFARMVHGSRYSLVIGVVTSLLAVLAGGLLGAVAAFYGGRIDDVIMRLLDVFNCIPPVLLALAVVAALGANMINLIFAITISCVPGTVRLVRSVVLSVCAQDYVEAARTYGAGDWRLITHYIIPNSMGPIIVHTTMNISGMILSAAGLSFIGMGIQPPAPEWGALLSAARDYMFTAPYLIYFPGAVILVTALSFNLFGDGLRDALDPRMG